MESEAFFSKLPLQTLRSQQAVAGSCATGGHSALLMRRPFNRHRNCRNLRGMAAGFSTMPKLNRRTTTQAAPTAEAATAAPLSLTTAPSLFDPVYRAKLAEEYGFTQIAEPLPPHVTVRDIVATIPAEAYKVNQWKAWRSLAISLGFYVAGLWFTAVAPWYLLPFAWVCSSAGVSGLFVVGHECGHKTFCSNKLVEDIVGTLALLPIIYPYESWRFKHDHHHAKTNMLYEDTAWHPIFKEDHINRSVLVKIGQQMLMGPVRFWGTTYHWMEKHFNPATFRPHERARVKLSIALVFAFAAVAWPLLIWFTGIRGWANFWLIPWLGFHFGMSTISTVHHSAPHIHFKDAKTWSNPEAQLAGTVNCYYPKPIEFLLHNINVHIPHHISPKIPSYNLPLANEALRKRWGKHFNETYLNWRLMKTLMAHCHMYDEDKGYVPFDEGRAESPILWVVRRWMPSFA